MKDDKYIVDFMGPGKRRCVFPKENYEQHKSKHRELEDQSFRDRIKKAVWEPSIMYPSLNKKNRFCFYYYEFESGLGKWYSKVVIKKTKHINIVITAHRTTRVKESKYFKPLKSRPC